LNKISKSKFVGLSLGSVLVFSVLLVSFSFEEVQAGGFPIFLSGTPTAIDGTLDAGWDEPEATASFFVNVPGETAGTLQADLYLMNDATNMYAFLTFPTGAADLSQVADLKKLILYFDNNNNGIAQVRDDSFGVQSDNVQFLLIDNFRNSGGLFVSDDGAGGAVDGDAAISASASVVSIELSHPLDADGFDFSFDTNDCVTIGLVLELNQNGGTTEETTWPGDGDDVDLDNPSTFQKAHLSAGNDCDPPAAPTAIDLHPSKDDGVSDTDNITTFTLLQFLGASAEDIEIDLFRDNGVDNIDVGGTTASGGSWTIFPTLPGVGVYDITATATDDAANTSVPSAPLEVTIIAEEEEEIFLIISNLIGVPDETGVLLTWLCFSPIGGLPVDLIRATDEAFTVETIVTAEPISACDLVEPETERSFEDDNTTPGTYYYKLVTSLEGEGEEVPQFILWPFIQQAFAGGIEDGTRVSNIAVVVIPEPTSTITIFKETIGGDDTFDFAIGFTGGPNAGAPTIVTSGGTGTSGAITVNAGTYSVKEINIPNGWSLTTASCTVGSFDTIDNVTAIVVGAGDAVVCTFENEGRGDLTIQKDTLGGDQTFDFTIAGPEAGSPSFTTGLPTFFDDFGEVTISLLGGTYSVSEDALTNGFTFVDSLCEDEAAVQTGTSGTQTLTGVVITPGEETTCVFENEDTEDPVFTFVPADIRQESDGILGDDVVAIGLATATDNNDRGADVSNDAPALFPQGVTIVTWTAIDPNGNEITSEQEITVAEVTIETITTSTVKFDHKEIGATGKVWGWDSTAGETIALVVENAGPEPNLDLEIDIIPTGDKNFALWTTTVDTLSIPADFIGASNLLAELRGSVIASSDQDPEPITVGPHQTSFEFVNPLLPDTYYPN